MKYILFFVVLCNALMARPSHEVTKINRPVSPLSELELYMRVTTLIKEYRKTKVLHPQDATLIAVMKFLKQVHILAKATSQTPNIEPISVEDHDLRCAIKYLEFANLKTKIL